MLDGFNLFSAARNLHRGQIGGWIADLGDYFTQPIRWLTGNERSDTFVMDDMGPGFWECLTLPRSIGHKVTRVVIGKPNRRRSKRTAGKPAAGV